MNVVYRYILLEYFTIIKAFLKDFHYLKSINNLTLAKERLQAAFLYIIFLSNRYLTLVIFLHSDLI